MRFDRNDIFIFIGALPSEEKLANFRFE